MERIQKSIHGVCLNKTFPDIDMTKVSCKKVAKEVAAAIGVLAVGVALVWVECGGWKHHREKCDELLADQDAEILGENEGN